jgi:hypothetical protein
MDSFKIVFVKDTFECENRLSERYFLTKICIHHKSHVWPKNFKKKNVFFSNFGRSSTLKKKEKYHKIIKATIEVKNLNPMNFTKRVNGQETHYKIKGKIRFTHL